MLPNEAVEFERFTKTERCNSRGFRILGYAIVIAVVFFIAAGEAGADSSAIQADGVSLMAAMISDNNLEIVTRLINAGVVDANAVIEDGITLLMHAAMVTDNPEIVTTLLDAGADARIRNNAGETALDIARRQYVSGQQRSFQEVIRGQFLTSVLPQQQRGKSHMLECL